MQKIKRLAMAGTVIAAAFTMSAIPLAQAKQVPTNREQAPTYVRGIIHGSVTWDRKHSPYVLDDDIEVPEGSSLTVEPGVEIGVACVSTAGVTVSGSLSLNGTAKNRIGISGIQYIDVARGTIASSNASITAVKGLILEAARISTSETEIMRETVPPQCWE